MDARQEATRIVDEMFRRDAFSRWLGIERLAEGPGCCTLRMTVRADMLNGFGIAHGGITYSLADSALAFASNSRGRRAVSVETSISHTAPLRAGDVVLAVATEEHCSNRIAVYRVEIRRQGEEQLVVGLFKGTVYRTKEEW